MDSRRLVVLPALAAAFFSAASAFASPSIIVQTKQCDGTFTQGGNTHHPTPTIQAVVQDTTGLRVGQARMGVTGTSSTRALWRFDANVNVSFVCTGGNKNDYTYTYSDPNGSDDMIVGECVYNAPGCGASTTLNSSPMVPLGQTICPAGAPSVGSNAIFPAGQFGDEATFNGVQFGSVPYISGTWDRPATYSLSAWILSPAVGHPRLNQRILSEQGAAGFWGFGLGTNGGLRLFDSRNTAASDVEASSGFDDGAWHKIDVVRTNGAFEKFYVDGTFIGSVVATSTDSFLAHPIRHPVMVGEYELGSERFIGQIDEIRVLDSALTDADVQLEYKGSNFHKFAASNASALSIVNGGLAGSNGDQIADTYTVADGAINTGTAPNMRWIFEAQSTQTVSNVSSTFTVTIDQSPPTVPQSLVGTPSGTNSITWNWAAPTFYCPTPGSASVLYQLVDAASGGNIGAAVAATTTGDPIAGTPNLIVGRRVKVTDTWGTSPLTASATVYTMAATPNSFTATSVSTASLVATWGANSNPGYTRYELTYTTDPAFIVGVATRVAIGDNYTATSVGVAGLAPGTAYYFRVRAFNGRSSDFFGGVPSALFASMTVFTDPPAPTLTGAPTAAPAGTTQIAWTWTAASGATGYTLYDTPTSAVMFGPNGAALAFTSSTLAVNTRYDAEVEADMPAPTTPSGRGHAFTYTRANPPAATTIAAVYLTSATFAWSANGNPANTFYQVIVATDATFGNVISTLTVTSPTATATGLLPGVTYFAQVQAINGVQLTTVFVAIPSTATAHDPEITVNPSPPSPYVAPSGLVGAWQFDENGGTKTVDGAGAGNDGNFGCQTASCVSTPTFTAGPPGLGSAASFSGLAGGAVLTNNGAAFGFTGSITVEAWVNPVTNAQISGAGIVAVGKQGSEDFALDVSAAHAYEFRASNTSITLPSAAFSPGLWTHVVGVYDLAHTSASLYLNGVRVATNTTMPGRTNSGTVLAVGNRKDAAGAYTLPFAGRVDSVRVIAAALTPAQVLADYLGGSVSSVTPTSPNNGVIVALPPNAFGAPAQIFVSADPLNHPIRVTPAELNAGLTVLPAGLTMVPNSLIEVVPVVGGVAFTTPLGSSATLTIPYSDPSNSGLVSGTNPPLAAVGIRMYTLNTAVNAWTLLPTTVDRNGHSASGVTPHFSVFALFAPSTVGSSLAGVRVFPVPWKPGSGGPFDGAGVSFSNLPASGTIRILTLGGRLVRDFSFNGASAGTAVWDGLNASGRRTASGVYFARITSSVDGTTFLVKFAIER